MAYSQEVTDLDEFIFGTDCTTVESSIRRGGRVDEGGGPENRWV